VVDELQPVGGDDGEEVAGRCYGLVGDGRDAVEEEVDPSFPVA